MAVPVSEEYREELRDSFKIFDKNNDGTITCAELEGILRSLGEKPTKEEVKMMMSKVDKDGDGTIDFEEFVELMATAKSSTDEEMLAAFRVFDADNNGKISKDELRIVMKNLGEKVSEEQLTDMIHSADTDGDGQINYMEFVQMMKSDLK